MTDKARVLIVDDSIATQRLLVSILTRAGHETLCADNAENIVDIVESFRPTLVMLDIEMPKISGIEAAEILLELPAAKRPIIVINTAFEQNYMELAAVLSRVDGFVAKPFLDRDVLAWAMISRAAMMSGG